MASPEHVPRLFASMSLPVASVVFVEVSNCAIRERIVELCCAAFPPWLQRVNDLRSASRVGHCCAHVADVAEETTVTPISDLRSAPAAISGPVAWLTLLLSTMSPLMWMLHVSALKTPEIGRREGAVRLGELYICLRALLSLFVYASGERTEIGAVTMACMARLMTR